MSTTKPIITIGREYGAGGRTMAKLLSSRLGINYYDLDLIRLTSKSSGFTEEDVRRESEELSSSAKLFSTFVSTASFSSYDSIYQAQKEAILEFAKNPCIIVGRCSNIVLREANIPSFDVFLYADLPHRLKRAAELAENGTMDLKKYVEKRDHYRQNYYKNYTKHAMNDYRFYNICLDTGTIGMIHCADILEDILRRLGYEREE